MYTLVIILILIACVLLALVVLIQNPKGGGLAAGFQSSSQIMGVRRTADFLEKATWTLAIVILALSLLSIFMVPKVSKTPQSEAKQYYEDSGPVQYQPPTE